MTVAMFFSPKSVYHFRTAQARFSCWRRMLAAIKGTKLPFEVLIDRHEESFRKIFAINWQ